ncbi:MAG: glycosyltransferase family 4 protein [Candidatus Nealsonbacteria bacterium]|nr:glycosyltransferase family 4 protein [Candidatus Nealsonbacteria bacterium]
MENRKVLFIGVSNYNLEKPELQLYLKKKFEGLSQGIIPLVLAKGKPFHKKIWQSEFYLLPPTFFFWPLAFFLAFWLCLTKKIDVIVAQSPLAEGFAGSILKRILRKELIVEVHGDWSKAFLVKKRKFSSLQKKLIPVLAKFSLKSADKIRVISEFTLEKAKAVSPDKPYFVFPTFTDIDDFLKEKNAQFSHFVLFVGNLQKVKGIDILLKAFARVSLDFPEFKLILIGHGPEKENLKSQSSALKIDRKVEFKGQLSLEETRNIMKNCYCLVLPSLSEGLGRVLAEAQALSKPTIASRVGGIPDLIQDGQSGFLFEVGNVEQLTEKLRTLLKDKTLAIEMGKKGREFIQDKFSNEKYLANYLEMINT